MSIAAMTWAWGLGELDGPKTLILLALGDRADDYGVCWPSQRELAFKARMSVRTVQRHLRELVEMGYVQTTVRATTHGRKGLTYRLNIGQTIPNPGYLARDFENVDIPPMRQNDASENNEDDTVEVAAKRQNDALEQDTAPSIDIAPMRQNGALLQCDTSVALQSDNCVVLQYQGKNPQEEPPNLTLPKPSPQQGEGSVRSGRADHELTTGERAALAECLPEGIGGLDAAGSKKLAQALICRLSAGWKPSEIRQQLAAPLPPTIHRLASLLLARLESNVVPDQAPALRRAERERIAQARHAQLTADDQAQEAPRDPEWDALVDQLTKQHPDFTHGQVCARATRILRDRRQSA